MASLLKFNCYTQDLLDGVHGDVAAESLKFALSDTQPIVADDELAADITEIVYTNVSTISGTGATSRVLQNVATSQDVGGTADLKMDDMTITAVTGAIPQFQFLVMYNDSATNKELIGWLDYGSALNLALGESLVVDFGAAGLYTVT